MKTIQEILSSKQFRADQKNKFNFDGLSLSGFLTLPGVKKTISCIIGFKEKDEANGIEWEHVSVKFCGTMHKTPSWEIMCMVKDFFWYENEEVHQVHPKASEYLHGVNGVKDILHLWRPIGGWKYEKSICEKDNR